MVRGLRDRGGHGFEPAAGLEALNPRERRALRRAIVRGHAAGACRSPVLGGGEANGIGEPTPRTPPSSSCCAAPPSGAAPPGSPSDYARGGRRPRDRARDARIGAFLFASGPIAERDQLGKRLINDGVAEPFDLHTLEAMIALAAASGKPVWRKLGARSVGAADDDLVRFDRDADGRGRPSARRRRGCP